MVSVPTPSKVLNEAKPIPPQDFQGCLCKAVDLFPVPIEVFSREGRSLFVNRAFLKCFHIDDAGQIVGRLNLATDPYLNGTMGISGCLRRVLGGETVRLSDVQVPFDEISARYGPGGENFPAAEHQDIMCFSVQDPTERERYIVAVFLTTKIYCGRVDCARAREYIDTHWRESFDLGEIARYVHVSRYHLARVFKKHAGVTPYAYYLDVKVQKIQLALRDGALSVAQAFRACGASYNGNFAKVFRERTGVSPTHYRRFLKNECAVPAGARTMKDRAVDTASSGTLTAGDCGKQFDDRYSVPIQAVSGSVEAFIQAVEMFPISIQIFSTDGVTIYVNRAVLETWNISDKSQIVGKYNLLKDPIVNDRLGLSDCVQRIFKGESMVVPDVKVPLEDFSRWYQQRDPDFSVESMYTDILNFPIRDEMNEITHIVSAFISTRMYLGKSDIARAREYIEKHCIEAFDLDKIAGIVHLSRYHFARLFKKHTGMTPYSYYQDVKIGRLKQALRDKDYSITEAFTACGLEYSGAMARLFKQKTGMTPSQYRKSQ